MTSKAYVFTTNNYKELPVITDKQQYLVFGKEVGESGTPHLQGYVCYKTPVRFTQVTKDFPGSHIEKAKSFEEAIAYCKKDGDFVEQGVVPLSNKRKGELEKERYKRAKQFAVEGKLDMIDEDIYIRHYSALKNIAKDHMPMLKELDWKETPNIWIYGKAGVGKTTLAYELAPGAYPKKPKGDWFDGYVDQENVIVNDVTKFHVASIDWLKALGEHQPFIAEMKGGSKLIRPKRTIVTSQYTIDDIWADEESREAMHRRYRELPKISGGSPKPWCYLYDEDFKNNNK